MPRKSAAALAVIPPAPRPHPEPPKELTARQATIWREIVRCRPPEYFDGACTALLVAYCRAADAAEVIAKLIAETDPSDLKRYRQLLMMAGRQSTLLAMLSAKLRLAPQHVRRVEQVLPKQAQRRPWEYVS